MITEPVAVTSLTGLIDHYFKDTGNSDPFLKKYVDSGLSEELFTGLKKEKKELKKVLVNAVKDPKNNELTPQTVAAALKYTKYKDYYKLTLDEKIACHFLGEVIEKGETDYVNKILPFISYLSHENKSEKGFQIKSNLTGMIFCNGALMNRSVKYPRNMYSWLVYETVGSTLLVTSAKLWQLGILSEGIGAGLAFGGMAIILSGMGLLLRSAKNCFSYSSQRFDLNKNVSKFLDTII